MKRDIAVITVGYVILAVFIFAVVHSEKNDYWKTIGVTNCGLYTALKESKGSPDSIEICENGGAYVVYDGVKFYYPNEKLTGSFLRAEIYTDKYVFGNKRITVGTPKDVIISAYKHKKELSDVPDGKLAYEYNSSTLVWFEFDEFDLVKKIILAWEL